MSAADQITSPAEVARLLATFAEPTEVIARA